MDHSELDQSPPPPPPPPPGCSICLNDPPVNGVQLKCGHIFCYLCIKNTSEITGVCALCRAEIGFGFNFKKHQRILGVVKFPSSPNGFYWFYEGYRGWWLFDAEPNNTIESAHQRGETNIDLYLTGSGGIYEIDLINMTQRRKHEEGARQRKICRSTLMLDNILGLAGLKGGDFIEALETMRAIQFDADSPSDMNQT